MKRRFIEVIEGKECQYCNCAVFGHVDPNPEDLEHFECHNCGEDTYLPDEIENIIENDWVNP